MQFSPLARLPVFAGFLVLAIALDQIVKYTVEASLPFQVPVPLLPVLALFRTYNEGIAFSMLSGFGDTALAVLSLAVVAFVFYLRARTGPDRHFAHWGYGLIIGGAIGNLIDRLLHGYVIDYILFHTANWSFAVFNLADAFISVGAGLILLDELLAWRKERRIQGDDRGTD